MWLLTGLLPLGFPLVGFIYWPQVLRSGVLPPDADSISIPMFSSVFAGLILSPLVLGVAWLCLRRYDGQARIAVWRNDRPVRSTTITFLFGGAATFLAVLVVADLSRSSPWYEYLWTGYAALWLPWLLGLRAAAIQQPGSQPT
jgi:hypothetical protein